MIKIDFELLKALMVGSRQSDRGRVNKMFHKKFEDPLQRMLNSMQPETYLQPHKHENPDKREVFIALTGKFVVIQFNDDGTIHDHMILEPAKKNYATEVPERTYHTIICLEPDSIIYEIKDGPYDPDDDKNFAKWAPDEDDPMRMKYIEKLLNQLHIPIP